VPSKRKVVSVAAETLTLFDTVPEKSVVPPVESSVRIPGLHIGTSASTAAGWSGSFYPSNLKARDFLSYYATKFNTVEIDSTYYATPAASLESVQS